MKRSILGILICLMAAASCNSGRPREQLDQPVAERLAQEVSIPVRQVVLKPIPPNLDSLLDALHDSTMVELIRFDSTFVLDIRYATTNNFTGQVLYDCNRCFLRKKVAKDLIAAHREIKKKGYRIKMFDGYRPLSVQWKMWYATPDKRYVGDPRKGSMHNRGCAVDLTLTDSVGNELDMGTPYDFFGKAAHSYNTDHSPEVLANRKLLRELMVKHGFRVLDTEWWHYSYNRGLFSISDMPIPCND